MREESTGPKGLGLHAAANHDERHALLPVHLSDAVMISMVTLRSPTISISHLLLVGGEIIIINQRCTVPILTRTETEKPDPAEPEFGPI
jgi:hypothetical protein